MGLMDVVKPLKQRSFAFQEMAIVNVKGNKKRPRM